MLARNDGNSTELSRTCDANATGKAGVKLTSVSEGPSKCFAVAIIPVFWTPRMYDAPSRLTHAGAAAQPRTLISGLRG
jgi:hypothetical protein